MAVTPAPSGPGGRDHGVFPLMAHYGYRLAP